MRLLAIVTLATLGLAPATAATIEAEHESDYVRVLEAGDPELWPEAIEMLLGHANELDRLAVASVVRRIPELDPALQARLAGALRNNPWHPRALPALLRLYREGDEPTRRAALESLLTLRSPGAMDLFRDLILEGHPRGLEALEALEATYLHHVDQRNDPYFGGVMDPVMDPRNGTAPAIFDRRYLPAALVLLDSTDVEVRRKALAIVESIDTPGIDQAFSRLSLDPDPAIRREATERLVAREESRAAPAERPEAPPPDVGSGIPALALAGMAMLAAVAGAILFAWAWRLIGLISRVRYRPLAKIRSAALGPIALEGEAQPAQDYLLHPVTGERCLYYAGADAEHPNARFYLEDDSGRVLVDPRRAVMFSDDDILVAGERIRLAGYLERQGSSVVVKKDESARPAYQRVTHFVIEALFGFGRSTSVTKMLFSDPNRCFWIWDDIERRPMGEARDLLWLVASLLLAGGWILIFAMSVIALVQDLTPLG